jgi:hypothetical protein
MGCLTIGQIYLFLDKELPPEETQRIQNHLDSCSKCRNAVEERRLLVQAAESLPFIKLPPDFTQQVMARIFPDKVSFHIWVRAIAGGLAATVFAFFLFYILSGKNLAELSISISQFFLSVFRGLSTGVVKIFKLLWHLINIIVQFFGFLFKGFSNLTSILSPEVQAGIIALTLLALALLFFGVRRKLMMGEKA